MNLQLSEAQTWSTNKAHEYNFNHLKLPQTSGHNHTQ